MPIRSPAADLHRRCGRTHQFAVPILRLIGHRSVIHGGAGGCRVGTCMDDCVWRRYRYIRIIRSDFARIHHPRHACHLFTLNRLIKLWSFPSLSSPLSPRHATKINPESVCITEDDTFDRYDHVPKTNSPLIDVMRKRLDKWMSLSELLNSQIPHILKFHNLL